MGRPNPLCAPPPQSLLDEIINSTNFLAERALHSIEQGLLNAPPASLGFRPSKSSLSSQQRHNQKQQNGGYEDGDRVVEESETEEEAAARRHREEVESGTHQLETLLWASIDKNFDRFEIYVLRNILCLRRVEMEWIRLGHYEGLDFTLPAPPGSDSATAAAASGGGDGNGDQTGEGEDALGVESVNRLRRRLQASQRLNCMLVAERARNAALLGEMRRLVGVFPGQGVKTEPVAAGEEGGEEGGQQQPKPPPFRFLHDKGDLTEGDAETPLTTTTAFSLSQLHALRELSTALRGVMSRLAESGAGGEEEEEEGGGKDRKKSWRRERLEYIETVTRKHLENVRGLELGKNGEVRDGEWDGGGRRLANGEVESLERVIGMLGGSREEQDRMDDS